MLSLINLQAPSRHETPLGLVVSNEFEIFNSDNVSIGIMDIHIDDTYVCIFNIYLEEPYRRKGIISSWLESLSLVIAVFNPVEEAKDFWARWADEVYYINE